MKPRRKIGPTRIPGGLYKTLPGFPPTCSLTESLSSSEVHRHGYAEAGDNVYEDVEGVKKMLLGQNSRKHKAGLKSKSVHASQLWLQNVVVVLVLLPFLPDPYADSHFTVSLIQAHEPQVFNLFLCYKNPMLL